jgi:hypothetical protein
MPELNSMSPGNPVPGADPSFPSRQIIHVFWEFVASDRNGCSPQCPQVRCRR